MGTEAESAKSHQVSAAPVFRLAVVLFLECGHVEWAANTAHPERTCEVHGPVRVSGYQIADKVAWLS